MMFLMFASHGAQWVPPQDLRRLVAVHIHPHRLRGVTPGARAPPGQLALEDVGSYGLKAMELCYGATMYSLNMSE